MDLLLAEFRLESILYLLMNNYNKIMHFGALYIEANLPENVVNREHSHEILDLIKCIRK